MPNVLRIDASMRRDGSITRKLTDQVIAEFGNADVVTRDLADGIDLIDSSWIDANFTDASERTDAQRKALASSDVLVAELKAAGIVVIGAPVYNFSVPAALKAWIDQICRARETFRYTENGPVGLLEGKRAIIVMGSGGVEADSAADYMTPYLRHVLGFVGIHDVQVIAADRLNGDKDGSRLQSAEAQIAALAA